MSLASRIKLFAASLFAMGPGALWASPGNLRVLTFHDIGANADPEYGLETGQFNDFLSVIEDEGYKTLRCSEFAKSWPDILRDSRSVLLTFDDGFSGHRDTVMEALMQKHMTGTFFVISSLLGRERAACQFAKAIRSFMSGKDIRELHSAGFEIGSHSHSHVLCGTLSRDALVLEISKSKEIIEQHLGQPVTTFSYPYGRIKSFSSQSRLMLTENGFKVAFTQLGTPITRGADLFAVPRINVDRFDSIRSFKRKLHGHYELLALWRNNGQ